MISKQKFIILDRDGVINQDSDAYIKSPQEWIPIAGSLEAIAQLSKEDYNVVIITNQSGIAREMFTMNTMNKIHQKLLDGVHHLGGEISAIFFCPHADEDACACRKPKPGMFEEFQNRTKCSLNAVYAVGDSVRDLQAALLAGALPVLVKTGNGTISMQKIAQEETLSELKQVPVYPNLAAFVQHLLTKHDDK